MISCRPDEHDKKIGTRIYESLLQLMELVGPLCDIRIHRPSKSAEAYFKMAAMDQELNQWASKLPEELQWPSKHQATMPASYFLLQYVFWHLSLANIDLL
jgi:hypothetical protein